MSSNFCTNVPLYVPYSTPTLLVFSGSGTDADRLSRCIQDAWVAFTRTGDPNCESIGKWSVYGEKRLTMMLGKDCHVEKAPYEDERRTGTGVKRKSAMS